MKMKKVLAVVMSLCMTAGVVSYGAPVISQVITARAAEANAETECYSFDETTGSFTLKGKLDLNVFRGFSNDFKAKIKSVTAEAGTVFPEDSSYLFTGFTHCTSFGLSNTDTSNVTNMSKMFNKCFNITELDLSFMDTRNVTDMTGAFDYCNNLKTITLGENFSTIPLNAYLDNNEGWVNANDTQTVISGTDCFAVIENEGINTYQRYYDSTATYPTKITFKHNANYNQYRISWNKVEGADRYGIAVYLAGKWKVMKQDITDTAYSTPKNLDSTKHYKVAVAARVNGKWDVKNAIENYVEVYVGYATPC